MATNFNEYCIEKSNELQLKLLKIEKEPREKVARLSKERAAYTQLYSVIKNAVKSLKIKNLITKTNHTNIKRMNNGVSCELSFKTIEITLDKGEKGGKLKLSPSKTGSVYSVDISYNDSIDHGFHIFRENDHWSIKPSKAIDIIFENYHCEVNKDSVILLLGYYFYNKYL